MKKIWKWILGGLLIVVFFIALGYFTYQWGREAAFYGHPMTSRFDADSWPSPRDNFDRHPMRMRPGIGPWNINGFAPFLPFMLFGGLLRLLLPIGILAIITYLAYQKGKADGRATSVQSQQPPTLNEGIEPIS